MPSPVDWATYPPQRCTASIISLSAGSTMARASSGSRSSIRSIEPLMSAKSAVTVLRSPSIFSADAVSVIRTDLSLGAFRDAAAYAPSDVPHSSQNLAPGLFLEPHFGHEASIGAAHSWQTSRPHDFRFRI